MFRVDRNTLCCVSISLLVGIFLPMLLVTGTVFAAVVVRQAPIIAETPAHQHAVIIASDRTKKPDLAPSLQGAEHAAKRLAEVLSQDFGFEVDILLGDETNLSRIGDSILGLKYKIEPGDLVFVYLAIPSVVKDGQVLMIAHDSESLDSFKSIPAFTFVEELSKLGYASLLVVAESCLTNENPNKGSKLLAGSLDLISLCFEPDEIQKQHPPVGAALATLLEQRTHEPRILSADEAQKVLSLNFPDLAFESFDSRGEPFGFFPSGREVYDNIFAQLDRDRDLEDRFVAIKSLQQAVLNARVEDQEILSQQISVKLTEIALDETDAASLRQLAVRLLPVFRHDKTVIELSSVALQAKDLNVRYAGIESLARIGNSSAIQTIESLVKADEALLREVAIDSLALLKSTSSVPIILEQLGREEDSYLFYVGLDAVEILRAPDDKIVEAIESNLANEPSTEIVIEALYTLGDIGSARAEQLILGFTLHPDTQVRASAVGALGDVGTQISSDAQFALERALKDKDLQVRRTAIESIGWVGLKNPKVLKQLQRFAISQSQDRAIRFAAIRALGRLGDSSSLEDIGRILYTDKYASLRRAAAIAIGGIDGAKDMEISIGWTETLTVPKFLFQVSLREKNLDVRDQVIYSLVSEMQVDVGEIGKLAQTELEFCRKLFMQFLPSSMDTPWIWGRRDKSRCSPEVEARAIEWLAISANPDTLKEWLAAIDYFDDELRAQTLESVAQQIDEKSIFVFMKDLANPDPRSRALTAELLGLTNNPQVVDPLAFYANDPNVQVREAIVKALGNYSEELAVTAVRNATSDDSPHVRRNALDALDSQVALLLVDDTERALPAARNALEARKKTGDSGSRMLANSHLQLVKALREVGDLGEAESVLLTANWIFRRLGSPRADMVGIYGELALIRASGNDLEASDTALQFALELDDADLNLMPIIARLQTMAVARDDYERVEKYENYLFQLDTNFEQTDFDSMR